jgi:hypothetical protein
MLQYNINKIIKHSIPQKQNTDTKLQHQKTKWLTFTYSRKEVRKITKLFKHTQIKILVTFKMQNTMQNIVNQHPQTDKYNKSGIYQTKCLDCPLKYTGQTPNQRNMPSEINVKCGNES